MSALTIGAGLRFPIDAVTETFGWIGNRGSGKTHAAKVMAEEMLHAGSQVVVIDPVDAWYGLRYGAEKGTPGLPIYVFGGAHGDAPLESSAGSLLADVVVEQGISAVFSLRHLPKGQQRRFVADFAERLYLRKGEDQYRTAVHVFIEEAHTFAPQMQSRGEDLRCLGAIQDLVLQGRGSGIGVSLITQRVATLSKAVLELAEVMCAFRTTGPNARKALQVWFQAQDGDDHLVEFIDGIASLPRGEAWVWSPGYLGLFRRASIRSASTFDSSATPPAGKARPRPQGSAAELDLTALGEQIRATVERAEADDPKRLHAEIRDLRRQITKLENDRPAPEVRMIPAVYDAEAAEALWLTIDQSPQRDDVIAALSILDGAIDDARDALQTARERIQEKADAHVDAVQIAARKLLDSLQASTPDQGVVDPPRSAPQGNGSKAAGERPPRERRPSPSATSRASNGPPAVPDGEGDTKLGKRERLILSVLAQYPQGRTHRQIAMLTGYSPKASTIGAGMSTLRARGLVDGWKITPAGVAALGAAHEPLPSGRALLDYWRAKLGKRERLMLDVLVDAYPGTVTHGEMAERCGYSPDASTVGAGMSNLRGLELADGWRASDEFMEAINE